MKSLHTKKKSAALLITLLIVSSLGMMALTMLKSSIVQLIANTKISDSVIAEEASRGGLELGMTKCKAGDFSSIPQINFGGGVYADVVVEDTGSNTCVVTSTGYIGNIYRKHKTGSVAYVPPTPTVPTIAYVGQTAPTGTPPSVTVTVNVRDDGLPSSGANITVSVPSPPAGVNITSINPNNFLNTTALAPAGKNVNVTATFAAHGSYTLNITVAKAGTAGSNSVSVPVSIATQHGNIVLRPESDYLVQQWTRVCAGCLAGHFRAVNDVPNNMATYIYSRLAGTGKTDAFQMSNTLGQIPAGATITNVKVYYFVQRVEFVPPTLSSDINIKSAWLASQNITVPITSNPVWYNKTWNSAGWITSDIDGLIVRVKATGGGNSGNVMNDQLVVQNIYAQINYDY